MNKEDEDLIEWLEEEIVLEFGRYKQDIEKIEKLESAIFFIRQYYIVQGWEFVCRHRKIAQTLSRDKSGMLTDEQRLKLYEELRND